MRFGCLNVHGWNVGKLEDLSRELKEWEIDVVGITETQMREEVELDYNDYRMVGKGRSKCKKKGGGVGVIVRKDVGIELDVVKVGECEMSEDIFAASVRYKGKVRTERVFLVVCYMTVEGGRAREENERKYGLVRSLIERHRNERIIVMGDMNAHIGIMDEKVTY